MITFKRDEQGNLVAYNEKGEPIGTVTTMGDLVTDEQEPQVKEPEQE